MKHISRVTQQGPAKADLWQEIVCSATFFLSDVVSAKGGSSPLVDVISQKCNPVT